MKLKNQSFWESVHALRRAIRDVIPSTFGWWIEIDHDIRVSVRWMWLGHPGVVHCGCVSDWHIDIALELLRRVDWASEVNDAIASVEETESALLQKAQQNRRLKLTNHAHLVALPSTEPVVLAPATFEEKMISEGPLEIPMHRLTREEIHQRLQPKAPVVQPSAPTQNFQQIRRRQLPGDYCLTRDRRRYTVSGIRWRPFPSLRALLTAIQTQPAGTFTAAVVCGGHRIDGPEQVYRMIGRELPKGCCLESSWPDRR